MGVAIAPGCFAEALIELGDEGGRIGIGGLARADRAGVAPSPAGPARSQSCSSPALLKSLSADEPTSKGDISIWGALKERTYTYVSSQRSGSSPHHGHHAKLCLSDKPIIEDL
jgi:hypothetical protein